MLVLLVALVIVLDYSPRFKREHDDPDKKERGPAFPTPAFNRHKHRQTRPIVWNSYGIPMEFHWNVIGISLEHHAFIARATR